MSPPEPNPRRRAPRGRTPALVAPLAALAIALAPSPSLAQVSDAARAEARAHFQRGMEFFDEGRFDAALAEFTRANDTAPSLEALYNVGRVHAALGHAVEASRVFEEYLARGGEGLPAARQQEVRERLERQRARIAEVWVEAVSEEGEALSEVIVSLDGVDQTPPSPGGPLTVSAGAHTLGVRSPGYDQAHLSLTVAGGDRRHTRAELRRITRARGTLRVRSSLPGVEVRVDDRPIGRTPLLSTVPVDAGVHRVVGRRPGYRDEERTVEVLENAEVELSLRLERDPDAPPESLGRVELRLPRASRIVRLDGEPTVLGQDGRLSLPMGPHQLRVEVAEREPEEQTIEVPAGGSVDLTLHLVWTPDAQAQRRGAAHRRRRIARVFGGLGVAFLGAGLGVMGWNEREIRRTDARVRELNMSCGPTGCLDPADERRGRELSDDQRRQNLIRAVSLAAVGVGVVGASSGLILWLRTPTDRQIDAAASARLELVPGGLSLRGSF